MRPFDVPRMIAVATLVAAASTLLAPASRAADATASLSDVRPGTSVIESTLMLRGSTTGRVDPESLTAFLGGEPTPVTVSGDARSVPRTTMLVIDTSGSMESSGMATVRTAVREFLTAVPKEVKVGVVSFASTSGVDVPPTTDHSKVLTSVNALRSKGETSLYAGVQDAVRALGTSGERSIVLLSDGGDTVSAIQGGEARERAQRAAAVDALRRAKVRAEVIAFKSPESNSTVLREFAGAGGGSVATAADRQAVSAAFRSAARALESQVRVKVARPSGMSGTQPLVIAGRSADRPFRAEVRVDLGAVAPVVAPEPAPSSAVAAPTAAPRPALAGPTLGWALPAALAVFSVGAFGLVVAVVAPSFKSRRTQRVEAIGQYGMRGSAPPPPRPEASASAIGEHLVQMGDRVMAGRDSTTKTMALLDRADLPWRAGEWLVLRIVSFVVTPIVAFLLFPDRFTILATIVGLLLGLFLPAVYLRLRAKRRARKFESILPDVMMLVATSLSSGFSLPQALDAVARDAAQPAAKEFSRALAETRIGADVSDALERMAYRMDSENMRWATMAIRIQREVGGNLADTLRTTAATLREREMLKRQVRALSAEGRLSAYVLIALPVGLFFYSMWTNYDYISLLWTTTLGLLMLTGGVFAMVIGVFWMRNVVKIEV